MFTVLYLAILIAVLGYMQPMDQRLGMHERGPGARPFIASFLERVYIFLILS